MKLVFEDIDKPNGVDGTVEFGLIYWEYKDTFDKISVQQIDDDIQKCFYLVEPMGGIKRILKSGPRKGLEIFDECCYDIADAFVIGRAHFIEKKIIAK